MPRKKKYENALIAKDIFASECNRMGDLKGCMMFKFLDLKRKDDRKFLKTQIEYMMDIFNNAIKELEEKKDESNDKHADESVEVKKKLKKKETK